MLPKKKNHCPTLSFELHENFTVDYPWTAFDSVASYFKWQSWYKCSVTNLGQAQSLRISYDVPYYYQSTWNLFGCFPIHTITSRSWLAKKRNVPVNYWHCPHILISRKRCISDRNFVGTNFLLLLFFSVDSLQSTANAFDLAVICKRFTLDWLFDASTACCLFVCLFVRTYSSCYPTVSIS